VCISGFLDVAKEIKELIDRYKIVISSNRFYKMFRQSCMNGCLEVVKWLYEFVNMKNFESMYISEIFMWTCRQGHIGVAKWINSIDMFKSWIESRLTECIVASSTRGHLELAKWLCTINKDRLYFEERQVCDIFRYAWNRPDVVEWFYNLCSEHSITVKPYMFYSAFVDACRFCITDYVKWLYNFIIDKGYKNKLYKDGGLSAGFTVGCKANKIDTVKFILSVGTGVNFYIHCLDEYLFRWLCGRGRTEMAKFLYNYCLEKGSPINVHVLDEMPFIWACRFGHLETVKWLLSLGVNRHLKSDLAFRECCRYGRLELAKYLYSLGDINIYEGVEAPFRNSFSNRHFKVAEWLWDLGEQIGRPFNVHSCNSNIKKGYYKYEDVGYLEWIISKSNRYSYVEKYCGLRLEIIN